MDDTKMKIRHLNIEVTKRCNQRCFYCFNDSGIGSPAGELKTEQWLRILHALKSRGLESFHLTGGEPFSYPGAIDILAGAQRLGLGTSILSNGFRIKALAAKYPEVFQALVVAQVSLDSLSPAVHNRRRGYTRAYEDATSAIQALKYLGVPIEISAVLDDENLTELPGLSDYAKAVNALLIVRPLVLTGRAANLNLSSTYGEKLKRQVHELRRHEAPITSDRFHYVVDERQTPITGQPEGFYTVHHNGRLKLVGGHEIDLVSFAA